jgi:predicted nucleotidyltransferase
MLPKLKKLLDQVVARYQRDRNVRAIFALGSIARGDANAFSDIDLLVIVKKPVKYVRYNAKGTHVEVDSVEIRSLLNKLKADPIQAHILSDRLPVYDPERLEPKIDAIVSRFKKLYRAPDVVKADLFIQLTHHKLKMQSALSRNDLKRAAFFASTSLEKCVAATYAINDSIARPAYQILRFYSELPKKPVGFEGLLKSATLGRPRERVVAVIRWIDFILPHVGPAIKKFSTFYKPWRAYES